MCLSLLIFFIPEETKTMFTDFELPIFKLYSMWDKRLEHFNLESVLYVTQVFKSSLMVQMSMNRYYTSHRFLKVR